MDKKQEILEFLSQKFPKSASYNEIKGAIKYEGYSLYALYLIGLVKDGLIEESHPRTFEHHYKLIKKKEFSGDMELIHKLPLFFLDCVNLDKLLLYKEVLNTTIKLEKLKNLQGV